MSGRHDFCPLRKYIDQQHLTNRISQKQSTLSAIIPEVVQLSAIQLCKTSIQYLSFGVIPDNSSFQYIFRRGCSAWLPNSLHTLLRLLLAQHEASCCWNPRTWQTTDACALRAGLSSCIFDVGCWWRYSAPMAPSPGIPLLHLPQLTAPAHGSQL